MGVTAAGVRHPVADAQGLYGFPIKAPGVSRGIGVTFGVDRGEIIPSLTLRACMGSP